MKRFSAMMLAFIILASSLISTTFLSPEVKSAGTPSPTPKITYITGDWIVNNTQVRENETIVLTGNLTVEFGGLLTLRNVTLIMNSTAGGTTMDDFYHIEVQKGGTMYILDNDNDNTTKYDASNITLNDTDAYYWFWVRDGSNFTMRNSELHECGGGPVILGGGGLIIYTDNATIDHSLLSNNYDGVILYGSDAVVSNNTIEWNENGVRTTSWSNGTVENNLIEWNLKHGLDIDGWDNTVNRASNPLVRGNKIIETGQGAPGGVGISIWASCSPILEDNQILHSTEDSMYMWYRCNPVIINCTFDAMGGNFGIVGGGGTNRPQIINSTIKNAVIDDLNIGGSYFLLTNTTFNKSNVGFSDSTSTLTVRWFLNIHVKDANGNPVPNANIRIRDNANGTFDENFTTNSNGYLNWTVLKEFYQNKSTKILYSPYNITVSKRGYLTANESVEMNESRYLTITLQDDADPIADAGPDQSVSEDMQVNFDASGSTDDVGILWYNWSFGDGNYDNGTNITTKHIYTKAGTYVVTLNVTDTIGQWDTDTCLFFINNVGPTADAGNDLVGNEGQPILFDGSNSTDTPSDQSDLIYTWYFGDGKSDTGRIVNHSYDDNGIYNATLIVTDDNGFVDSDSITVRVRNVAPAIESVPAQTVLEDCLFTLQINATDVPADTSTFSDNTTLFDINPITGLIEFTPTNDDVGNHSVNITVMDDDGGLNYTVLNITVLNTNDPPVIEAIGQQVATEDEEFTLQVLASDVDVGDVLTYSLIDSPAGMSINHNGLITWTPTNDDVGEHSVTVKVKDSAGAFDTESFTVTVSNVNDPPVIIPNSLANATEDSFYMAYIWADDVDAGDTLTYSLDTHPTFLSIDPVDGMIFGTPDNDDVGTHKIVVNVTDGDSYVTRTFNLTVVNVNDAPVIASTPILMADVNELYSYDVIANDVDNEVLTYSLIEAPDGMSINGTKIIWRPTNEQQGKTYPVIVEVSDGEITTTQSFVVGVNEIPEKADLWLPLLLGLIGGFIAGASAVVILRKKKMMENAEKEKEDISEKV